MKQAFKLTIDAGLFVRGMLRKYLDRMVFEERVKKYHETKYMLDSRFIIVGADEDVINHLLSLVERN